jgi:hypothetical protein
MVLTGTTILEILVQVEAGPQNSTLEETKEATMMVARRKILQEDPGHPQAPDTRMQLQCLTALMIQRPSEIPLTANILQGRVSFLLAVFARHFERI